MKQFLRKWNELANERVQDLEKFKKFKREVYVEKGYTGSKSRLEREIKQIESAIEFNKEIILMLKAA